MTSVTSRHDSETQSEKSILHQLGHTISSPCRTVQAFGLLSVTLGALYCLDSASRLRVDALQLDTSRSRVIIQKEGKGGLWRGDVAQSWVESGEEEASGGEKVDNSEC